MSDPLTLPPLPMPAGAYSEWGPSNYTERQMQDYARAAILAERERAAKVEARYQWLANRVLACDYGDNDEPGEKIGWRIVAKLCHGSAMGRQPAFMFGPSIDAAIDAAIREGNHVR